MKKLRPLPSILAVCSALLYSPAFAAENSVAEFDPKEAESLGWRVVDDGVMGGLSKGKIQISKEGILKFNGDLSLKNNGGFSSLRTGGVELDLSAAEGVVARVRGDGRTYQMRFGTEARFRGMEVSFSADLVTEKGKWIEVKVPFEKFSGSFRGMKLKDESFNPGKIRRVGLILGDKKPGPFELEVDWIRTFGADSASSDVVSVALADGRFGTLAKALTNAKLVETLQGKGPFTVFAPTDKAFAGLPEGTVENLLKPENLEQLQAILKYHVLAGSVDLAGALSAKEAKTVQGEALQIGFTNGQVKVNGAALLEANVVCSNGVIHVIDSVLLPPKPANDIGSVAKRAGSFGTLLAAIDAAGLSGVLASDGPITVFAPTDEAFKALPKGTVESLLKPENLEQLKEILSLHAVAGKVSAGDALNARKAKTVSGGELKFEIVNGVFQVNGVTVVKTDIECDNGVIHVIDAVILPPKKEGAQGADRKVTSPAGRIESAIDRGVPVFNRGDHGECAQIYRDCLVAIAKDENIDPKIAKALRELLEQTSKIEGDAQRAWVLRSGLDKIYVVLAQ
ncbi:MAG: putative surface protein with fasciclin (FAS1) repeats [Akkermansiaceae bacterium]|jgi:uncharacterized surface protein with fasciclin (FAS1) repeats